MTHVRRVVILITAVNTESVRHNNYAIIATYYRLVKKRNVFNDLELMIFHVQLVCYGYESHFKVICYANMNITLFRVSAYQISVFSITQQSR